MSELTLTDEKRLLIRVAAGEEVAFGQLFNIYHKHLSVYVFRISGSIEMTEEIVLDVFLKIWLNRELLREVENFKSYLFVMSKNHTINCIKKTVRERELKRKLELDANMLNIEAGTERYNFQFSLLDEAVDLLPPQQKKVFVLSKQYRFKYAEIARETNLSRETVKKYLQLATMSIRTHIRAKIKRIAGFSFYFFPF